MRHNGSEIKEMTTHTSPIGRLSTTVSRCCYFTEITIYAIHSVLQGAHADYVIRSVLLCCQEEVKGVIHSYTGDKGKTDVREHPLSIQWEIIGWVIQVGRY